MNIKVRGDSGSASAVSSVVVDESAIVIRIGRPGGTGESADCTSRADRSALLGFAARADCYQGLVLWHRYEAVYALLLAKQAESDGPAGGVESGADVYTRLYDPLCQVAASYATAAGVRQCTAEHFVEAAVACMERIPAVGRLMRDGLICPAWFRRVVEQTALVDDADLLAFIDAEIAHTLSVVGKLSAGRVEALVSSIVAEHDPDAVTLTREQVKLAKQVRVNPLGEGVSEVIVTASTEDAMVVKDVLDAVIAGVCSHDPRTRGERRSAAAVALTEKLVILGGDSDVDRFIQQTRSNVFNQRAEQDKLKVKAMSYKFNDHFINGDVVTDPKGFDGLKKRVVGNQVIDAGTNGMPILGDGSSDTHAFFDKMDELLAACPGADAIYASRQARSKIISAGRRIGGVEIVKEDMTGKRVAQWQGVPILDLGDNLSGGQVLPVNETLGTASNTSSMYAVRFGGTDGDQATTGLTNGGVQVDDLGQLQEKPALRTRIEFYCGLALFGGKAAARLRGVIAA